MAGSVLRTSIKPRMPGECGLPKRAVAKLDLTEAGAAGDYNHYRTRELPGDRDQAVLLLTDEVMRQLKAEGWPVEPGDLGENLSLTGIAESSLGPGVRLGVGDALLEISHACDPCTELYVLPYVGKERGPAFLRALHGRRGWYARVLRPGVVEAGMALEVTGPGATAARR